MKNTKYSLNVHIALHTYLKTYNFTSLLLTWLVIQITKCKKEHKKKIIRMLFKIAKFVVKKGLVILNKALDIIFFIPKEYQKIQI